MPYKDSIKRKEYARKRYLANRDSILEECRQKYKENPEYKKEKSSEYRKTNSQKIKERYNRNKKLYIKQEHDRRLLKKEEEILLKGGKCSMCGLKYNVENIACFDFHHVNPELKSYNPSTALRLSNEKKENELAHCVLVCANCHRIIHSNVKWKESLITC